MKPQFIIAGATRSGTTTLHGALEQHPNLYLPPQKELDFFWKDGNYQKGFAHYETYFKDGKDEQMCGEASPSYMDEGILENDKGEHYFDKDNDSAARIHAYSPAMKIIFSLRNPVTRSYSIYQRAVWGGWEKQSFEAAIEEELSGKRTPQNSRLCYLERSNYVAHIKRWLELFPREQLHFVLFEGWTPSPSCAVADIEKFLNVSPSGITDEDIQTRNVGRSVKQDSFKSFKALLPTNLPFVRSFYKRFTTKEGYEPLSDQTFEKLQSHFAPQIAELETLTGMDFKIWSQPRSNKNAA